MRLQCVGVCDSSGAVWPLKDASEVDDARLALLREHKAQGGPLAKLPEQGGTPRSSETDASAFLLDVTKGLGKGTLVVDCTASEATLPALLHAASPDAGLKVVLANKKPVAATRAAFATFRQVWLLHSPKLTRVSSLYKNAAQYYSYQSVCDQFFVKFYENGQR